MRVPALGGTASAIRPYGAPRAPGCDLPSAAGCRRQPTFGGLPQIELPHEQIISLAFRRTTQNETISRVRDVGLKPEPHTMS